MPKRTLAQLGETPESESEFEFPEREPPRPYFPDFSFAFEPQSYVSEPPFAPLPETTQFTTPRTPFSVPTFGGGLALPLNRLGELQLRGDYTYNPQSRPDFSLGFGFTRRF